MKSSIKDFASKCNQIRSFLRIWSHLLKKSLMENFIFLCSVCLNVFQGEFLNLPALAILNTTNESFREYEP